MINSPDSEAQKELPNTQSPRDPSTLPGRDPMKDPAENPRDPQSDPSNPPYHDEVK